MRRKKSSRRQFESALIADAGRAEVWEETVHVEPPSSPRPEWYRALKTTQTNTQSNREMSEANLKDAIGMVERFHGAMILLEKFDRENVRGRVKTKENHPPREFAIVATYLRTLAHVRTLIELKSPTYFQAISMIARAVFELAVDIRLIDRIPDAPERYDAFSKVERLRVARRIIEFHTANEHRERHESPDLPTGPLQPFWVHEQFIRDNAEAIDQIVRKFWPKEFENKRTITHWSGKDLRQRAILVGPPFDEIYDVHYAELSWYTHPGVGVIATLAKEMYPLICGQAYGIAIQCYYETLGFMIQELRLHESDQFIEKKLEFARLAGFSDDQQQAEQLRYKLLGF